MRLGLGVTQCDRNTADAPQKWALEWKELTSCKGCVCMWIFTFVFFSFLSFCPSFSVLAVHNYSFIFITLPSFSPGHPLPNTLTFRPSQGKPHSLIKGQLRSHTPAPAPAPPERRPRPSAGPPQRTPSIALVHPVPPLLLPSPRRLISFTLALTPLHLEHLNMKSYGNRNSITKYVL